MKYYSKLFTFPPPSKTTHSLRLQY